MRAPLSYRPSRSTLSGPMLCAACGTENEPGSKFCGECGSALAAACPACGTANSPGVKFCGECGSALGARAPAPSPRRAPPPSGSWSPSSSPTSSASRPRPRSETPRTRASSCRATSRSAARLIDALRRHRREVHRRRGDGGLGDADGERGRRRARGPRRARPGRAVSELDPTLAARAGVLTGEAAVTLGAEGQGMVAGDLVNTAVAHPVRRRAGHGSRRRGDPARDRGGVAFEDGGRARAEGKAEPLPLCRALRVVAGAAAARRSRPVSRRRSSAVTASCGSSRSSSTRPARERQGAPRLGHRHRRDRQVAARLGVREVLDGLAEHVWWHRGRCLAYGEGVTFWALAEMVRMRAGIARGRGAGARARRSSPRRRGAHRRSRTSARWVEPRLAHLLGLAERHRADREDLFSAWRLFFERLADRGPVVLVFEDLHWADAGAARLHRVPARVVAQPSDLRGRADAPGAARAPARPSARAAAARRRSGSSRSPTRRWRAARRARPGPAG